MALAARLTGKVCDRDTRELAEATSIESEDLPVASSCGCRDDQVVGPARRSGSTHMCQQSGMRLGDVEFVRLDRDRIEHRGHKALALLPSAPPCQPNPHLELGDGDRSDRDIVAVADRLGQL